MKFLYVNTVSVLLVVQLFITIVNGQQCKGGAHCITLRECPGLYAQLIQGNTPHLTRLLRALHCGFQGDAPKICCPPEFLFQPQATNYENPYQNYETTSNSRPLTNYDSAGQGRPESHLYTSSRPATNYEQTDNRRPSNSGSSQSNNNQESGNKINKRPIDRNKGSLLPDTKICGISTTDRIVGGEITEIDEHPWMALLRYDKPRGFGFYCGGVLISSRYVMTAAHCVKGEDLPTTWKLSQVRLGEWNTSTLVDCVNEDCNNPPVDVPVEEIIAHESYDPKDKDQQNDIALLRLTQDVQFNDFIKPICLPLSNSLKNGNFEGYTLEVAGWGKTESRSESDVKLKVRVPVVSTRQCGNVFSRVDRVVTNKQICAGGVSGQDSCRGDSGGALMGMSPSSHNWVAIGVVSYGPSPCGTPDWPGVYTRVGAFVNWINSKLRP